MDLWPSHVLGLDNPSGHWYLFWSGWGGRTALATTFLATYWRHHNCHEPRCWRLQKHPDGHMVYCRKHHPLTSS